MLGKIGAAISIEFIRFVVITYTVVSFPFYWAFQRPWIRRRTSAECKAKQIDPDDPESPWIRVGHVVIHFCYDCLTADELFRRCVSRYRKRVCFGTRNVIDETVIVSQDGKNLVKYNLGDYKFLTYEEANSEVETLSKSLLTIGVKTKDIVLIFAETRREWMLIAQAVWRMGATIATLYATLGEDGIVHGISELKVAYVFTSSSLLEKLIKLRDQIPSVKHVIYFENKNAPSNDVKLNYSVETFSEFKSRGQNSNESVEGLAPKSDDIAIIMYTSGSTGVPKGVILKHRNLMGIVKGVMTITPALADENRYIAFLPLAHIFEMAVEFVILNVGGSIGYSSPLTMTDSSPAIAHGTRGDAILLEPTVMSAVPLVYDRLKKAITNQVESRGYFASGFFNYCLNYKIYWTKQGYRTPIIDRILCRKIRAVIGGKMHLLIAGGAPLSVDTEDFIKNVLNCNFLQGYGLTETAAGATIMDPTDNVSGSVGYPLTNACIKLKNWDEGGYRNTDKPYPRGEIVIGGEIVSAGYYKNEELTKECYSHKDNINWFYTGDIGEIRPNGSLRIIDRKKDLVKLQHGEYVSLGKVENELKASGYVDNVCVYGDSFSTYVVALILPNEKAILSLGMDLGKVDFTFKELCMNEDVIAAVLGSITDLAKKRKLHKTEIPLRITLCTDEWTPDSGYVTAAFKLKRNVIVDHYKDVFKAMYKN